MSYTRVIDAGSDFYIGDWDAPQNTPDDCINIGLTTEPNSYDDIQIPIRDSHKNHPDRLKLAIDTVNKVWWQARHGKYGDEKHVLVHCAAGMSRSPMMAKCIMYKKSRSWEIAQNSLKHHLRYEPDIHPKLEEHMKKATEAMLERS